MLRQELDPFKVSSPRIFLVRMLVFLTIGALLVVVLNRQIWAAFLANPGLNALIIGVLLIGILLAFRQVLRLFPEIAWVNSFRLADPGLAVERAPVLLAPMAAILRDRIGRMAMSSQTMRSLMDSIANRLDEARDMSRYMTGLLVFLGLLGTFWGLIETVGSVGKVIEGLKVGGDAGSMFESLKEGLAAPLGGMGISFSSSLFGLAGSLILGFLDLQTSQAQNRFYTELEDWLATTVRDLGSEGDARRRRRRRHLCRDRAPQPGDHRGRLEQDGDRRDGEPRGGDPGPHPPYAQRAAADPRMGRRPGRPAPRNQAAARNDGARPGPSGLKSGTEERDLEHMALARGRRERSIDYWPGFVDALSTLVLGIIFLLTVFVVVQFFLSQEVAGKDTALTRLNVQIAQLTDLLSLEKTGKVDLEDEIARLRAGLSGVENERDRLRATAENGSSTAIVQGQLTEAQGKLNELSSSLDSEKSVNARALAQVEILNQQIMALRRQLGALELALDVSERKDKDAQAKIADLGQRLNVALAQRVQELSRYRSDFFGRLREILGNRPDIRVVGDRFVFPSEVFFDSGQAVLSPEGRLELDKLAGALLDLDKKIPSDIPWVLRVDGHTDVRPIASPQFPSNWALSASRAISVVQYLVSKGISPQRLVAAGFGEFQPLDPSNTEEAFRRNRRLELKLTER